MATGKPEYANDGDEDEEEESEELVEHAFDHSPTSTGINTKLEGLPEKIAWKGLQIHGLRPHIVVPIN